MYRENDNLNWEEINRFRSMTPEELDELMTKYEEKIKKSIAQDRKNGDKEEN